MAAFRRFGAAIGLLLLVGAGLGCYLYSRPHAAPTHRPAGPEKEALSVFFGGPQGRLQKRIVEVSAQLPDKARADIIFRELKEARSIPDRLRLYELAVGADGVLYLNLSKELVDPASPAREITVVYSIVDSFLASFPRATRVQLLLEGEPAYTRSGLLYIRDPLEFNKELLED